MTTTDATIGRVTSNTFRARAHGPDAPACRALQHRNRRRHHLIAPICGSGRFGCGAITASTPATPSSLPPAHRRSTSAYPPKSLSRQGRVGLRHLRRLLLSGQAGCRGGRRNTAVEEALYLSNIASHVTLVHRRDRLRSEKILQDRLFALERAGKVDIVWNHAVDEILGDPSG